MNRSFLLALILGGAALGGAGCQETWCDGYVACTETGSSGMGGSSTSSSASSTSTMMTSSSTGVVMDCVPTLTQGPKDDTCGVFVDPLAGDDGSDGTMAAPMKTLTAAIAEWTPGKAIYVCDGALSDASNVAVLPGVIAYGGLDCANAYRVKSANARTTLAPGPGVIPLTLTAGASPIAMQRFAVTAAAGAAAGSSAIGVIIDDVPATLEDFDITAGDGVAGASSVTPTDFIGPSDPNDAAIRGNNGNPASALNPTTPTMGGSVKVNALCAATGGKGGDGGEIAGTTPQPGVTGSAGSAVPSPSGGPPNDGLGGPGDMGAGCGAGHQGAIADPVLDGDGASGAASLGTLALDGYHGVAGSPGATGNPGQGGGGGGGARGKHTPLPDVRGASAGSGGAGGCGGNGAQGGGAGGASIALVLLGGTAPTLSNVTLATGKGGDGGAGAAGQFGVTGGNGGAGGDGATLGLNNGCPGGNGGKGSNGGAGGGGRGGHSVGIAYVGKSPSGGFGVAHDAGGLPGSSPGAGIPAEAGIAADGALLSAQ